MGYSDVFGGQLLFPSQLSYLLITTAVDIELQWPREQQIGGTNVVADFLDIDATAAGVDVTMPSASATGTGNKATINNVGSNSFDVVDNDSGAIITIAPGEQWVLVLTDNTTNAGTWSVFQLGATVSVANASALAGAGIKAISTTLNQKIDSTVEAATPFTVVDGDRAQCSIYTAGAGTCNLPSPGTVGDDWFFMLRNSGSGTLNVVPPSGNIDGGASLNLDPNDSCFIFTDGTDFFTVGLSTGSTIAFDFVEIAVPGSGDFVLSGANLDRISYRFTGALTGNRRIVVPNTTQQYWVDNQTTGAFTLEIDTAAGAGQVITQGESAIVYSDGTDVINAVSSTSVTFPITIGQGGTGATNAADARTNLDVPPNSRAFSAGFGIAAAGLGDLSADRTINAEVPTESVSGAVEIATQAETDAGSDDVRYITPLKLTNFPFPTDVNAPVTQAVPGNTGTSFNNSAAFVDIFTDVPILDGEEYLIEAWIYATSTTGGQELQVSFSSAGNAFLDGWDQALTGSPSVGISTSNVVFFSFNTPYIFDSQGSGISRVGGAFIRATLVADVDGVCNIQARQLSADANSSDVESTSWFRVTRVT